MSPTIEQVYVAGGLTLDLTYAAAICALAALAISARDLGPPLAAVIVLLRFAFPVVHFAWVFNPSDYTIDDWHYFLAGHTLSQHHAPWSLIATEAGRAWLSRVSYGPHYLYQWWNGILMWFLGPHYFVPVLGNVLLTFVAGAIFFRLLRSFKCPTGYSKGALVFFLLHWDVIAWSSFVNFKDTLVMTLSLAGLYAAVRILQHGRISSMVLFVASMSALLHLRRYVPVYIVAAMGGWMLRRLNVYTLVGLSLALVGILWLLPFYGHIPWDMFSFREAPFGLLRIVLTPQPWSVDPGYSYLTIPAILHWVLIVPALYGVLQLRRLYPGVDLLLIYAIILLGFYSVFPALQGPRHRYQIVFLFAWSQYHAIWEFASAALLSAGTPATSGTPGAGRSGRFAG